MSLRRKVQAAVFGLGFGLSGGLAAHAADFCIASGGLTYVGKSFRVPPSGKCKAWSGFILGLSGDPDNTTHGTACASSDGGHVDFALTTAVEGGDDVLFDHLSLPKPSLAGGERSRNRLNNFFGDDGSGLAAEKTACPTTVVPISTVKP